MQATERLLYSRLRYLQCPVGLGSFTPLAPETDVSPPATRPSGLSYRHSKLLTATAPFPPLSSPSAMAVGLSVSRHSTEAALGSCSTRKARHTTSRCPRPNTLSRRTSIRRLSATIAPFPQSSFVCLLTFDANHEPTVAYALQRTATAVTLASSCLRLSPTMQPARQPPRSLKLGVVRRFYVPMKIAGFILTPLGVLVFFGAVSDVPQNAPPFVLLGYFVPSLLILITGVLALTSKPKKKQREQIPQLQQLHQQIAASPARPPPLPPQSTRTTPAQFKFSCPHCGQHIFVTTDYVGTAGSCPTCNNDLTVPAPSAS